MLCFPYGCKDGEDGDFSGPLFLIHFNVTESWPHKSVFFLIVSRYQYVLGERTWIEYWPTKAECKTDAYKPICDDMNEMVQDYTLNGCRQ